MKKLVFSAAALTMTGTAFANDSDWAQLDQDIQALSASLAQTEEEGMQISGRIRAAYENSGDIVGFDADGNPATTADQNDLGGFAIYNARLDARGTVESGIGYHLQVDFANNSVTTVGTDSFFGGVGLLDAYLDIPVGDEIGVRVGQFRARVSREGMIDSGDLFFFDRSIVGAAFAGRSQGVAAHGNFDAFNWAVSVQNGADSVGDELFYAVRGDFDIFADGEGGQTVSNVEGAFGVDSDMAATVGAAFYDDGGLEDGAGFVVDGSIVTDQFSVSAGFIQVDDSGFGANFDQAERMPIGMVLTPADTTVISVAGTFKLTDGASAEDGGNGYGRWDIGARFQTFEAGTPGAEDDVTIIDVGLNHFVDGHDMKYIIGFTQVDMGDLGEDVSLIRVGVNTRF